MTQGLDSPAAQERDASATVVPLGQAAAACAATRRFLVDASLAGFVSGLVRENAEQWFQSFLAQLGPGEHLSLRIAFGRGSGLQLGAAASAPPEGLEARAHALEQALREIAASAAPYFKLARASAEAAADLPHAMELRPAGQRVSLDELVSRGPRQVSGARTPSRETPPALALYLAQAPRRRPNLLAVAELMRRPQLAGAALDLDISIFRLDARYRRALQDFLKGLVAHVRRTLTGEAPLVPLPENVLHQIMGWSTASEGLRVSARLHSPEPVPAAMLDMLCQALYGTTRRTDEEAAEVDLTAVWPSLDLGFLAAMPAVPAVKARLDARRNAATSARGAQAITLGRLDDDARFVLDAAARRQHVYMIGGTGTGKSTLMLNMIHQDMKAGRAVIVIDPHGDLWEKALRLVPDKRRGDLVLVHPTDARGAFTMNILERLGDDVQGEHSRITGELLDYFKRSQWKEVPEAFGPMFENFFRNGLQLLLSANGKDASILDFQRVFCDDAYRAALLAKCRDPDVTRFWCGIVAEARYEASLSTHAPYIVSKMSPITGNTHLRRILGSTRSSLDFAKVIEGQQICLINLAQPHLGKESSRFLGGMITARLVATAKMVQAAVPEPERKRVDVYMDEFQTYISAGLADGLAEVRKYGLNLVLANQSLSQLQGDRYQAEVAEAVLSNAANVIAFRVGIHDARRLAGRFEPELPAAHLARLPNFHAAALVVRGRQMPPPEIIATLPEPKPPRPSTARRKGETLAQVRTRIAHLVGKRSHPREPMH